MKIVQKLIYLEGNQLDAEKLLYKIVQRMSFFFGLLGRGRHVFTRTDRIERI
jgi:hypothetical protein